ncbi:MAG: flavodoxin [Chloroflexi bacterium]|nr:flavodoxin [Chloroflexota bacterium]
MADIRVLVTVASKHGGSDGIGDAIAGTLRNAGLIVDVVAPKALFDIEPYDAVVGGSAVYVGRWLEPARAFVIRHSAALLRRPVWLFSSGPLGQVPGPVESATDVPKLLELSGAREHRIFAGRLDPSALGIGERTIVRVVKAPCGDFRNWDEIGAWAHSIAEAIAAPVA